MKLLHQPRMWHHLGAVGVFIVSALVVACAGGMSSDTMSGNFPGPLPTISITPLPHAPQIPLGGLSGTPHPTQGEAGIPPTQAGAIPAFSLDDLRHFVTMHPIPRNVAGQGNGTIITAQFTTSGDISRRLGGEDMGMPDETPIAYVETMGTFAFLGSSATGALSFPIAFQVFRADTGNLMLYGGLEHSLQSASTPTPAQPTPTATVNPSQPTPTATAIAVQSTATPILATPTPTANPPALSVTPSKITGFCTNGQYPNSYTVMNTGSGTLTWSVSGPSAITFTPASGSLGAGTATTVHLSGAYPHLGDVTIHFTSNGGNRDVTLTCQ